LNELITLGRTLKNRARDVLAYFDRPGTSIGPTEAINGRLEHLRGSALGFRNLTYYIARSLLETGRFRPRLHPRTGDAGATWAPSSGVENAWARDAADATKVRAGNRRVAPCGSPSVLDLVRA